MTLAIGAKYPWGSLHKFAVFQGDLPQAIIFVTDSRWTRDNPNNQNDFEDVGTKLFGLTTEAAMVYAGDVISGEHCIKEFGRKLQKIRRRSFRVNLYIAQQTFQETYKYHRLSRKTKVFPLYFLIGVCDKAGRASLIYLSSPKFKPLYLEGMHGIGEREALRDLENAVNQEIDKGVKEEFDLRFRYPVEDAPHRLDEKYAMKVAMWIGIAMREQVIDSTAYPTVGGPLQIAIIEKTGITTPEVRWTKDVDDWHSATAQSDETTTYQDKYKLGPAFISSSSFGLYRISD